MYDLNIVIQSGTIYNLDCAVLPSGTMRMSFTMKKTFTKTKKETQEKEYVTEFITIEAFGKLAELMNQKLQERQFIEVIGKLRQDTWEKEGKKQTKLKIVADDFKLFQESTQQATVAKAESIEALDDLPF